VFPEELRKEHSVWIPKRALLAFSVVLISSLSLALAVGAFGDRGRGHDGDRHHGRGHHDTLIEAALAPSVPTDPAFHGVTPGGAPWVLRRGEVKVDDGRLDLRVRGLVIPVAPGNGTPGPVNTISASLYCGADAVTAPAATSDQVPISRAGDARIPDRSFDVPDTCLAPVILVYPNGDTTRYIAVDGTRP
jgi:hypothetical protein